MKTRLELIKENETLSRAAYDAKHPIDRQKLLDRVAANEERIQLSRE